MAHNKHTNKRKAAGLFYRALQYSLACCLCSIGILFNMVAAAQESGGGYIEEVLVTAQKRSESVQEIGSAISVFTSEVLDDRRINGVEELYQLVPGLTYSDYMGSNHISIRGIGFKTGNGVGEASVATHVDGVFLPRSSMSQMEPIDLERVEVLRGPQGSLYGRNATAGVINYISKAPTQEFEGQFNFGAGSFDMLSASGFVSGPLSSSVLGRVSFGYEDRDGHLDNVAAGKSDVGGQESQSIRGSLRFLATDDLTIDLIGSYSEREYDLFTQQYDLALDQSMGVPLIPIVGIENLTDDPDKVSIPDSGLVPDGERDTAMISLVAEWLLSDSLVLKSTTGYIDHDKGPDNGIIGWFIGVGGTAEGSWVENSKVISQEFNLSGVSMNDRLEWITGLYYYEEDFDVVIPIRFLNGIPIPIAGVDFRMDEETSSTAVFVDLTYSLSDNFRVNASVRHNWDEKEVVHYNRLAITPTFSILDPGCGGAPHVSDRDWSTTTPGFGIEWDINDDVLFYLKRTEGFQGGGSNVSSCGDLYGPEEVTAYEAGIKSILADGRLLLNITAYDYEYEGMQQGVIVDLAVDTTNLDRVDVQGVEVELKWYLSENLSIDAMASYSDSEINEDRLLRDSVNQLLGLPRDVNVSGNPLPKAPKSEVSIGINYTFNTDVGRFDARAEYFHSSKVPYTMFDHDSDSGPSYNVTNLYLTYAAQSERYGVRAYLRNAGDEDYLYSLAHSANTGYAANYHLPRNWGLELTFDF